MPNVTSEDDAVLNGVDEFLIEKESFKPEAYRVQLPNGNFSDWTYGYGFEFKGDEQTRVQEGDTITKEEARPLLRQKTQRIHEFFKKYPAYEQMTPAQKVGVISFGFNNGINVFDDPDNPNIRGALDSGNMDNIQYWMRQFMRDSSGQIVPGLVNRRNDEVRLMNDPTYLTNPFDDGRNPSAESETTGP